MVNKIIESNISSDDCLVIVPIFNEEKNIRKVIEELRLYFKNILVIDDGSFDNSALIAENLDINIIKHLLNLGQGAAIETGLEFFLKKNLFQYAITFDGDGQNNVVDAFKMLNFAKKEKIDAVIGTRFGKNNEHNYIPFFKKFLLRLAVIYERLFYSVELTDAHNGLRVLSRRLVEEFILPIKNHDMAHATEISYKLFKSKCKIKEYPIKVEYKNKRSQNPLNAINIAIINLLRRS